jgi:GNAT superfamily N-acetyltransferase
MPQLAQNALLDATERIRRQAAKFATNFFASREQVGIWLERGVLSYTEHAGSLLIYRWDRDLCRLYHVAAGLPELSAALDSARGSLAPDTALVSELVGVPEEVDSVAQIYREHGYDDYTSLVRLVRINDGPLSSGSNHPSVVFAEETDVPALGAFLERVLDPLRDQIPEPEEIRTAAGSRKVLVERLEDSLAGVLFFETTGLTSMLRYWYVDPRFCDRGIGGRLIKTYLGACGATRIVLWVVANNTDAIAKYGHYGFQRDKLVDLIMVYKGNS